MPYVSEYQKTGLNYDYIAYQNWADAKQKVVRDGVETVIIVAEDEVMYEIFPAMDTLTCWKDDIEGGDGPTRRRRLAMADADPTAAAALFLPPTSSNDDDPPQSKLGFVLPDLSEERWEYKGREAYDRTGGSADVWRWDLTEGDMEMHYTFYTDASTDEPLELNMVGINLYTGGHKDNYVAYYYGYEAVDSFPEGMFSPPVDLECSDAIPDVVGASHRASPSSRRPSHLFRSLMPNVHWGEAAYDAFVHRHGRRHSSREEYRTRHGHYAKSARFVANFPKDGSRTHTVALNHLADWSREEYLSLLGRRPGQKVDASQHSVATVHNFTTSPHFLPAEVMWKGTPADSPVKDQAACGSCWSFSATASLESAVYRSTGKQTLLSEQHMMDCGWGEPGLNTGCFGGDQHRGILWALKNGGLAKMDDYPYRGVNDFCHDGVRSVPISGRLVFVEGGEESLMAALLAKGPMAVSVDAESDEFRFYSGGLFSNPDCAMAAEDLNHAVIASGYGVAEDGTPFWLVKNMWSTWWGEEGYIRMARTPNDCGIATQPMYVELDEET